MYSSRNIIHNIRYVISTLRYMFKSMADGGSTRSAGFTKRDPFTKHAISSSFRNSTDDNRRE